jgi:UTP:GlnB (protein PII) uridylyltransferase
MKLVQQKVAGSVAHGPKCGAVRPSTSYGAVREVLKVLAPSSSLDAPSPRRASHVVQVAAARAPDAPYSQLTPFLKIDNMSDAFATKVTVQLIGGEVGELLETITALKNLNLNIRRAKVDREKQGQTLNTFYLTDAQTSEKIIKSARLEEIRMTIMNGLLAKMVDPSARFAVPGRSETRDVLGVRPVVKTDIAVTEAENGSCSVLKITTVDRAGLLVDIVSVLKDINLNVVSAEVDTIGFEARDEFFITYHGEPLNYSMVQLVTNALQYYLSLNEVATEESY